MKTNLTLETLKKQKATLLLKALRQFPNSPIQHKTMAAIHEVIKQIKTLENQKLK